jgi:putative ABC transport system permease protein
MRGRFTPRNPLRVLNSARTANGALLVGEAVGFAVFGALLSLYLITAYRPFGATDVQRLVVLQQARAGIAAEGISVSNSVMIEERSRAFRSIARLQLSDLYLKSSEGTELLSAALVSPGFLDVFHGEMVLGRSFQKSDEAWNPNPVCLLTESYWLRATGGNPSIVGRTLQVRDPGISDLTVVGVLRREFKGFGFFSDRGVDIVLPQPVRAFERMGRNGSLCRAMGLLAAGWTLPAANAEVGSIGRDLDRASTRDRNLTLFAVPPAKLFLPIRRKLLLSTLATSISFLLIFVCAAGVLQVQAVDRIGEIFIRRALGAEWHHIVSMLIRENCVHILCAAVPGAFGAMSLLEWLGPVVGTGVGLPPALDPREVWWLPISVLVMVPVMAILVAAAQMSVLVPSFRNGAAIVRFRWTPGRVALRRLLVVVQGAMAATLAFGALASLHGLIATESRSLGFDVKHTLTARVTLRQSWTDDPRQWAEVFDSLVTELKRIPNVLSVGVIRDAPGYSGAAGVWHPVEPLPVAAGLGPVTARGETVATTYFREMGLSALSGKVCDSSSTGGEPGVVINKAMADRYWPDADPIGSHFQTASGRLAIIGVVPSVRRSLLEIEPQPEVFLCAPLSQMYLVIRQSGSGEGLASILQPLARRLDREAVVDHIMPVEDLLESSTRPSKVLAGFLATLGFMGMIVAGLGQFAIAATLVRQRRGELAIRIAVGADPSKLGLRIEIEGIALGLLSILGGLAGYEISQRYAASGGLYLLLPGKVACMGTCVFLLLTWVAAKWPARRLRYIDLMSELKQE